MIKTFKKDGYGSAYIKKKKTKAGETGRWSEKKKLEVATTWLSTGSNTITSAMTGVPVETILGWREKQWWKDMILELQTTEDMELSSRLKSVVDKSLAAVLDRVENGEFMYDPKLGRVVRVPAKLRDVQRVLNESVDKRMLLQRRPTKITEHQNTVDDRLAKLADQFAMFVKGQPEKVVNEIIEGDDYIKEVLDVPEAALNAPEEENKG